MCDPVSAETNCFEHTCKHQTFFGELPSEAVVTTLKRARLTVLFSKAQLTHCQAVLIHFRPLRGITRRLTVIWSPTQDPQSTRESFNTTCHGENPKRDTYSRSLASQPYFSFRWEEREKEKYGWLAKLVFAQR